jgi:hypothetical protein
MTHEAEQLLAAAMKQVGLSGSFVPEDTGAKVGLSKAQAEAAARSLSNAGILTLGFDLAAHFTPDYRKARTTVEKKTTTKTTKKKSKQKAHA